MVADSYGSNMCQTQQQNLLSQHELCEKLHTPNGDVCNQDRRTHISQILTSIEPEGGCSESLPCSLPGR